MPAHGLGSERHKWSDSGLSCDSCHLGKFDSPMGYEFYTLFQPEKPESQRVPISSQSQPVSPAGSLNEIALLLRVYPVAS